MSKPTVAAGFALGLLELAVSKGASASALLARSRISPEDLEDTDRRIPFETYVALMRAAKALTADPALSLHYGEAANIAEYSIVGLIGEASGSMREAFHQLNRFVRLVADVDLGAPGDRFRIERSAAGVWLIDTREDPDAFPELTESAFAQLVCWSRRIGLQRWARAVEVTHAEPGYREEYDRIFQAPIRFNASRNALLLDPAAAEHRIAGLPRYAFGILSARAEALVAELELTRTMRGTVERLLAPILHTGEANVIQAARQLGMSRQTLHRRLKAEGVTFAQVLDELRCNMALRYLGDGRVSVHEAAYLIGFSEPTAFTRAFRRWTGVSPRTFRHAPGSATDALARVGPPRFANCPPPPSAAGRGR